MSNASHQSLPPEPSDRKVLFSAIGWIGVFFIFALIVLIAYVDNRRDTPDALYDEERLAIRQQVDSTQTERLNSYSWVNQNNGVVQIPVERAMQLVVRELQQEAAAASSGD